MFADLQGYTPILSTEFKGKAVSTIENKIIDKRVLQRHLVKGSVSRDAFQSHLDGLEDKEEEAENIWPLIMEGTQSEASVQLSEEELEGPPDPVNSPEPLDLEEPNETDIPAAVDFSR